MADRPVKEVEITPAMIEAGEELLMQFEWGWSDPEEYVRKIYSAMRAVSPEVSESVYQPEH